MKKLLIIFSVLALLLPLTAQAASPITYVTDCVGTSSCTASNLTGDLEIAYAGRNSSATAPSNASGWTNVGTKTINGTSSNDSGVRMSCRVTTSDNQASGTFTNASSLVIHVYRNQAAGTTATCASAILGTPSFFASTVNTTSTTETFNSVTNGDAASWDAGFGYAPSATGGITTAPTGMTNRSSNGTIIAGHDTNGPVASFTGSNVTLTTAGRIITGVVEISAHAATTPSFSGGTGTYDNDESVAITADAGDTVCYTTDGSTPTATTPGTCSNGSTYSSPVSITSTGTTLQAIATKADTSNSAVQSATYTLTVGVLFDSPGAGSYVGTQSVTLSVAGTTGATIHYTTDGSAVTCSSATYSGAFNVSSTETVKAIACKTNYNSDTAISDLYTIIQFPSVTTDAADTVTTSSANLNGTISDTGGETGAGTDYGFAYGTDSTLSSVIATSSLGTYSGTGTFSYGASSLSPSTTYYYRAYVTNSAGTAYGSISNFTTDSAPPPPRRMELFEGFVIRLISGTMKLFGQ